MIPFLRANKGRNDSNLGEGGGKFGRVDYQFQVGNFAIGPRHVKIRPTTYEEGVKLLKMGLSKLKGASRR